MAEERIFFEAQGLKIEALLENLGEKRRGHLYPHPIYGGSMHNNVVKAVAHAYQEEEYTTLRFNFRAWREARAISAMGWGSRKTSRRHSRLWARRTWISQAIPSEPGSMPGSRQIRRSAATDHGSPPVSVIDFSFLEYNLRSSWLSAFEG